jgi:hypothetical protein
MPSREIDEGRSALSPAHRLRRWRNRGDGDLERQVAGSTINPWTEVFALLWPSRPPGGYDNERGKGDHRHFRGVETAYQFSTVEQLIADFWRDVRRLRGDK